MGGYLWDTVCRTPPLPSTSRNGQASFSARRRILVLVNIEHFCQLPGRETDDFHCTTFGLSGSVMLVEFIAIYDSTFALLSCTTLSHTFSAKVVRRCPVQWRVFGHRRGRSCACPFLGAHKGRPYIGACVGSGSGRRPCRSILLPPGTEAGRYRTGLPNLHATLRNFPVLSAIAGIVCRVSLPRPVRIRAGIPPGGSPSGVRDRIGATCPAHSAADTRPIRVRAGEQGGQGEQEFPGRTFL